MQMEKYQKRIYVEGKKRGKDTTVLKCVIKIYFEALQLYLNIKYKPEQRGKEKNTWSTLNNTNNK